MAATQTSQSTASKMTHTSIADALFARAASHPDRVAFRTLDDAQSVTWGELARRASAVAGGLSELGVGHGDTVALMICNRMEFNLVDFAVAMLGGVPFSVYNTASPEQIAYVLEDSGARVMIADAVFLPTVAAAREVPGGEGVECVVGIDPGAGATTTLAELEAAGSGFDGQAAASPIVPDDLVTLVYTSGTTGPPKGVELTHGNVLAAYGSSVIDFDDHEHLISWLPAAHIAERMAHHYIAVLAGATVTCCPDPRRIVEYVRAVRPTWFFAVPRIWEKLHAGLQAAWTQLPDEQRQPIEEAVATSLEAVRLRQAGEPVPAGLQARVDRADVAILSRIREQLGMDRLHALNVGAAPCPRETIEFFHAIGLPLSEIWGMSETSGGGTLNRPGAERIGTVGTATPAFEIKLAEDGELLVRSAAITRGYRNKPEATADAIDADGWLHTGDVGTMDADGYVTIVDRKKELIISAGGKNMSPANIEAALKAASPLIGQAVAIGDRRPYNVGLVVLDPDYAPAWATQHGIEGDLASLASEEAVIEAVRAGLRAGNAHLNSAEQIKRFALIPGEWLPGGEELTPTMKLKRKPISERYAETIDALYAGTTGVEVQADR